MSFRITICFVVLTLLLFAVPSASAHSSQPRVEISMERLNPGGVVDVRGVSFGMDETVALTLLGSGVEISLGEIIANGEGEFIHIVALPTDLVEGTYYFRAVTSHHWVISPPLTVWGTANIEGGGQGPRDDADGLLAPMPTFPPAGLDVTTAPTVSVPVVAPPGPRWNTNLVILALLAAIFVVVVVGFRKKGPG